MSSPRSILASKSSNPREYISWGDMKTRCYNPKCWQYKNYGARGISVCSRWRSSFINFFKDIGPRPLPKSNYSLDRIDNDGNYEPGNCRWATRKEQSRNIRNNRFITIGNKTMIVADWCQEVGIKKTTFYSRLNYGWTPKDALLIRVGKRYRLLENIEKIKKLNKNGWTQVEIAKHFETDQSAIWAFYQEHIPDYKRYMRSRKK